MANWGHSKPVTFQIWDISGNLSTVIVWLDSDECVESMRNDLREFFSNIHDVDESGLKVMTQAEFDAYNESEDS